MSRIDIEGFLSIEHQNFDILAIPHGKSFIVKSEKAEEFKSVKPNHKVRQEMEEMVKKIRVNNLVESNPTFKKIKKLK